MANSRQWTEIRLCDWPGCDMSARSEVSHGVRRPFRALCSAHRPLAMALTLKEWDAYPWRAKRRQGLIGH